MLHIHVPQNLLDSSPKVEHLGHFLNILCTYAQKYLKLLFWTSKPKVEPSVHFLSNFCVQSTQTYRQMYRESSIKSSWLTTTFESKFSFHPVLNFSLHHTWGFHLLSSYQLKIKNLAEKFFYTDVKRHFKSVCTSRVSVKGGTHWVISLYFGI